MRLIALVAENPVQSGFDRDDFVEVNDTCLNAGRRRGFGQPGDEGGLRKEF